MLDAALLVLRGVSGGLLAGHGAQKVFGAFGGPGPQGARGMAEKLGLRPSQIWGHAAGLSELAGGGLTALGALSPVGPLTAMAPMVLATRLVHWNKPVWNSAGGAELPLLNMAAFATLGLAGPGKLSVDGALGIRLPRWLVALTAAGVAGGTAYALATRASDDAPARQEPQAPSIPDPEDREDLATAAEEYREQEVELRAERAAARRSTSRR